MIDIYYMMYTENILRDTTIVTGIAPLSCSGSDCTSIYLPGGIDLVRLAEGGPNATLFGAQLPDGPTFLVNNAPGYQLEFFLPTPGGYVFNSTRDCATYGGTNNEALHICVAAEGTKILAGEWMTISKFNCENSDKDRLEHLPFQPLPVRPLLQRHKLDQPTR